MAIAVVHGGEVIYTGDFGVKKVGEDDPIDPETVFRVASLSKSIAATTVAKAITDQAVEWNTSVIEKLPDFALADPYVTENATIGNYFSHRTGLETGAGDDLEVIGYDRDYILAHLRLQPLQLFHTSYNYSNMGITVGASATAAALGMSWEDAVVIDLAKWINVVLAEGALHGKEYIDPAALSTATSAQIISTPAILRRATACTDMGST